MANQLNVEEHVVDSIIDYMKEELATAIAEVNVGKPAHELLVMPKEFLDDPIEPSATRTVPVACVWVEKSNDIIKDRALRQNVCVARVLFIYSGSTRIGYRFADAFTSIIVKNPTLGCREVRANVVEREFYPPVYRGQTALRAAECVVEVQQEVKRT